MTTSGAEKSEEGHDPVPVAVGRRLQLNPQALKLVPAERRQAWGDLEHKVVVEVPGKFRRRWTDVETLRVIVADPSESYTALAEELDRSPGAIRYRRQAMMHLLRDEHGARARADAYRDDPKAHHKQHDYFQVDEALRTYGFYDKSVSEQFEMAKPLRQPSTSWRGDGTGSALASGNRYLRDYVQGLLRQASRAEPEAKAEKPAQGGG